MFTSLTDVTVVDVDFVINFLCNIFAVVVFRACPTRKRPGEDPGHAGGTMSLGWPGNASGSPPEELEEVSGEREI